MRYNKYLGDIATLKFDHVPSVLEGLSSYYIAESYRSVDRAAERAPKTPGVHYGYRCVCPVRIILSFVYPLNGIFFLIFSTIPIFKKHYKKKTLFYRKL